MAVLSFTVGRWEVAETVTALTRSAWGLDTVGDDWRTRGACRDEDPEMWWDPTQVEAAVHRCVTHCPVLGECRRWAETARLADCVAGGVAWVRDKATGGYRPSRRTVTVRTCRLCRDRPTGGGYLVCGGPLPDGAPGQTRMCSDRCRAVRLKHARHRRPRAEVAQMTAPDRA